MYLRAIRVCQRDRARAHAERHDMDAAEIRQGVQHERTTAMRAQCHALSGRSGPDGRSRGRVTGATDAGAVYISR